MLSGRRFMGLPAAACWNRSLPAGMMGERVERSFRTPRRQIRHGCDGNRDCALNPATLRVRRPPEGRTGASKIDGKSGSRMGEQAVSAGTDSDDGRNAT